jgi:hypothetical protein
MTYHNKFKIENLKDKIWNFFLEELKINGTVFRDIKKYLTIIIKE